VPVLLALVATEKSGKGTQCGADEAALLATPRNAGTGKALGDL